MAEKRKIKRIRRRLSVTFESGGTRSNAFTANVSPGGMQIVTRAVFQPGTKMRGMIVLPEGEAPFEAEVRWARQTAGAGMSPQNSMGMRFTVRPSDLYVRYLKAEWKKDFDSTGIEGARPFESQVTPMPQQSARPPSPPAQSRPGPAPLPARTAPAPGFGQLRVGAVGRASSRADEDGYRLKIGDAAQLVEAAARAGLAGLPAGTKTAPVNLEIVFEPVALARGMELTAEMRVTRISIGESKVFFEGTVQGGGELVATALHARSLV